METLWAFRLYLRERIKHNMTLQHLFLIPEPHLYLRTKKSKVMLMTIYDMLLVCLKYISTSKKAMLMTNKEMRINPNLPWFSFGPTLHVTVHWWHAADKFDQISNRICKQQGCETSWLSQTWNFSNLIQHKDFRIFNLNLESRQLRHFWPKVEMFFIYFEQIVS